MNNLISDTQKRYELGDMTVTYLKCEDGRIGYVLMPSVLADKAVDDPAQVDALVQLHVRGDDLAPGFINGFTLSETETTYRFVFDRQEVNETDGVTRIVTYLKDQRGLKLRHNLIYRSGDRALTMYVVFENGSDTPVVLEHISSFTLGSLPPFGGNREKDHLRIHRARSWWSAEGRFVSETVEELHMERSWSGTGTRSEIFGQTGSMPVRRYFPFVAAEDEETGMTWAAQLACPSSWQIELRRNHAGFFIDGGIADHDFGHWTKTIAPGETFETPNAFLTAGRGNVDEVSQRLLDLHPVNDIVEGRLPVIFNEFCTTWGNPTEDNIRKAAAALKGKGVDYFVIDAGWYGDGSWMKVGDWYVNENRLPRGIEPAVAAIREAGMKAGIWFEPENCTKISRLASEHPDWLLTRYGVPVNTGNRMFLNMAHPGVQAYLQENVIEFLKHCEFGYIKIDYNDCIGMGCDDPDGLGEGLRKNMLASQEFFRKLHREVPGLIIENCSSGGHRLEPSMMEVCDIASFSDAHECVQIPIIAANIQRLIQPAKSQIWAVLRKTDSIRRLNYSLVNTLLGVMCLSGDVYDLSEAQWKCVEDAVGFYSEYSHVIRNGTSCFYGTGTPNYGDPAGWQAVARYCEETGETLVTVHTFGGPLPDSIRIPVRGRTIRSVLNSEDNNIVLEDGWIEIELKANFEAIAILTSE